MRSITPTSQKILLQIKRELAQTLPACHARIVNEEQTRVELAVKEAFDTLHRSPDTHVVAVGESIHFTIPHTPISIERWPENIGFLIRDNATSTIGRRTKVQSVEDVVLYVMFLKLLNQSPDAASRIKVFKEKRLSAEERDALRDKEERLIRELADIRQRLMQ